MNEVSQIKRFLFSKEHFLAMDDKHVIRCLRDLRKYEGLFGLTMSILT